MDFGGVRSAWFKDSEGNLLSIAEFAGGSPFVARLESSVQSRRGNGLAVARPSGGEQAGPGRTPLASTPMEAGLSGCWAC